MRKILLRGSGILVLLLVGFSLYYSYAQANHSKLVTRAVSSCSTRVSVVLAKTDHDIASIDKAIRTLNESIVYIDAVIEDVHVHASGAVHFNSDEQCFTYMKLCGDTLRREKSFLEAVSELDTVVDLQRDMRQKGKEAAEALRLSDDRREKAFDAFLTRHKLLRESLTEMVNESGEIEKVVPRSALVDIGAIEHAQREIDAYPTRWSVAN